MAKAGKAGSNPKGDGGAGTPGRPLRFYDNRQKYLGFVTTTNEKWTIAQRVARELVHIDPRPPALRVFDAGVGDGAVLFNVMRAMHERHPHVPFQVTGKEISVEDLRMALERAPDRLVEHPPTVLVFTNMLYREAPTLTPGRKDGKEMEIGWHEVALAGTSSFGFAEQLRALDAQLVEAWRVTSSPSGNPVYAAPSVLVVYRADHRFMLDDVIPRRGEGHSGYDLLIASQPWRARTDAATKARNVLLPLAEALAPGGRMVVAQSVGGDPGEEIIRHVWDDEALFPVDRYALVHALRDVLGERAHEYDTGVPDDSEALVSFRMHTLPDEIGPSIGTSSLHAAWNAATYVAQIDDARIADLQGDAHLDATKGVLAKYGGLWFNDEAFVISRKG